MTLDEQIESVLFFRGEPVKINKLADLLKKKEEEIKDSLNVLENRLKGGLRIISNNDEVMLGTNPEASELITELTREELNRELGKAGLETLSIVLYKGPVSKKEIDYIRGVNSSFILRNLSVRGLVEKFEKSGSRKSFYRPTIELLSFLGLKKAEELPEYEKTRKEMGGLRSKEKEEKD